MTAAVFVDTNVLVYARDAREPAKQARAAAWLDLLWHDESGHISVQVLTEYYVTLTRRLEPRVAPTEAWDEVTELLAWRPQAIDEAVLRRARDVEHRYRLSWWDSMIVAAAQAQSCELLLSEDLQDGAIYGGVTVRSPFTLSAEEPGAAYSAVPSVASRHPARGRPKRRAPAHAER
jgi:predicted nucleic acid-binding protein